MCGIFGYIGKDNCLQILTSGLESLKYRGHDSSGVAYFNKKSEVKVYKKVGTIDDLEKCLDFSDQSICGIAHNRWATHGKPTEVNCHPHSAGKITLVHNGIIENYSEFKNEYIKELISETDTEIIAKLINENYLNNLQNINQKNIKELKKILIKSINDTIKILKGAFAVALICADIPNEIFVFKNASPIIIGASNKCKFISSDISAIYLNNKKEKLNYFNLNDNEIAVINIWHKFK